MTSVSWRFPSGADEALAQSLENEQDQYGAQADDEEEQVLGHDLPPPLVELGVQKDDEEDDAGVDRFGPPAAHTQPDGKGAGDKTGNLVAALDKLPVEVEVAAVGPVAEDQHRNQQAQQAEDPVGLGEALKTPVRHQSAGRRTARRRPGRNSPGARRHAASKHRSRCRCAPGHRR